MATARRRKGARDCKPQKATPWCCGAVFIAAVCLARVSTSSSANIPSGWGCPSVIFGNATLGAARFYDTTDVNATVYDARGVAVKEEGGDDKTEDRHFFTRESPCGTIHFNVIECTCRRLDTGAPSFNCEHNGTKTAILSNFSSMMAQSGDMCPEAAEIVAGVYTTDPRGSYTAERAATNAKYSEKRSAETNKRIDVEVCTPPCADRKNQACKKTYDRCNVKCDHPLLCKKSRKNMLCMKTCGFCGDMLRNHEEAKKLMKGLRQKRGILDSLQDEETPCQRAQGDWEEARRSQTNLNKWPTPTGHTDVLAQPENRELLEKKIEEEANKHHWRILSFSNEDTKAKEARYPFTFGGLGKLLQCEGDYCSDHRSFFAPSFAGPDESGTHNCCSNACGPSTPGGFGGYPTRPFGWDQTALEPMDLEYSEAFRDGSFAYPAGCKVPESGIPEHAHLLRVQPCGGEYMNTGVFCVLVKITNATDPLVDPLVQGFGDIVAARRLFGGGPLQVEVEEKDLCYDPGKEFDQKTRAFHSCSFRWSMDNLRAKLDGIIRRAIAQVRFIIAQRALEARDAVCREYPAKCGWTLEYAKEKSEKHNAAQRAKETAAKEKNEKSGVEAAHHATVVQERGEKNQALAAAKLAAKNEQSTKANTLKDEEVKLKGTEEKFSKWKPKKKAGRKEKKKWGESFREAAEKEKVKKEETEKDAKEATEKEKLKKEEAEKAANESAEKEKTKKTKAEKDAKAAAVKEQTVKEQAEKAAREAMTKAKRAKAKSKETPSSAMASTDVSQAGLIPILEADLSLSGSSASSSS